MTDGGAIRSKLARLSNHPRYSRGARADPVELRLLLVAERIVEIRERRLDDVERLQHGGEPLLHGGEPAGRGQRLIRRTALRQDVRRLGGGVLELLEGGLLGGGQVQRALDPPDRQLERV